MKAINVSSNVTNIISIVDSHSTNYKLFENLYIPIVKDEEFLKDNCNKLLNVEHRSYRMPNPVLLEFTLPTTHQENTFTNTSATGSQRFETTRLPKLIKSIDTRNPNSSLSLFELYNINKYFTYNLEKHQELIENNYYPLTLGKETYSSVISQLPGWAYSNTVSPLVNNNRVTEESPSISTLFLNWVEDATIIYWKKVNHSYVSTTALKDEIIHSFYNEKIWNAFEGDLLNLNESNEITEISPEYNFTTNLPARTRNRNYRYTRSSDQFDRHLDQNKIQLCLNSNSYGDVSYMKDELHRFPLATPDSEEPNDLLFLPELIKQYPKKRIKVIKLPSWKTQSNDTEVEYASYTRNQFLKRQTSFAPIIYNYKYLDKTLNISKINYFALVSNADRRDIEVKKTSNTRIEQFFTKLLWEEGIQLWDPIEGQKILEKLYAGLNKYTNRAFNVIPKPQLNSVLELDLNSKTPLNSYQNTVLIAQPKVNRKTEQKYKKISSRMTEHYKSVLSIANTAMELRTAAQHVRFVELQLEENKSTLRKTISECKNRIQTIHNSVQFIDRNTNLYDVIKKKYNNEYNDSIIKNNYGTNSFLDNLAADSIKILFIEYSDGNGSHTLDNTKSNCEFIHHVKAMNQDSKYLIKELEFLIDRPVKIRVDGNNSKIYAGGPYIVRVTQNQLSIKLAYRHSLFGISSDGHSFCVHPHATHGSQLDTYFKEFTRGCLGEASSLIYNAFKENNLKLIILACMTWVSSANSSDPWGKKYDWFVKFNSLKTSKNPEPTETPELVEEEVTEFLENIFDIEEEEVALEPLEQNDREVTSPLPVETIVLNHTAEFNPLVDFTAPPDAYTPYNREQN